MSHISIGQSKFDAISMSFWQVNVFRMFNAIKCLKSKFSNWYQKILQSSNFLIQQIFSWNNSVSFVKELCYQFKNIKYKISINLVLYVDYICLLLLIVLNITNELYLKSLHSLTLMVLPNFKFRCWTIFCYLINASSNKQ